MNFARLNNVTQYWAVSYVYFIFEGHVSLNQHSVLFFYDFFFSYPLLQCMSHTKRFKLKA